MRVSAASDSPDYWRRHFRLSPRILLDGRPLRYVVWADDVAGEVELHIRRDGRFVPADDRLATEIRKGKVEILAPLEHA